MKNTFLLLYIFFISHTLYAQTGTVFDNLSMHSDILNMDDWIKNLNNINNLINLKII